MKKLGSNLFVVLPPRHYEKPVDLIIAGKMKIYEHTTESNEKNYSFGFTLSEDQREAFQNIEKRIKHLANESKPTVKKLSPKFANKSSKRIPANFRKFTPSSIARTTESLALFRSLLTVPKNRSINVIKLFLNCCCSIDVLYCFANLFLFCDLFFVYKNLYLLSCLPT